MKFFFIIRCIFLLLPVYSIAQVADTTATLKPLTATPKQIKQYKNIYNNLLDSNIFLQSKGQPQALAIVFKTAQTKQSFFYLMAALLFFLGLLRTIFSRYFSTLFRVFFNTSLRQNQLTDQLEQATLPSLLFNVFFVLSAGLYIYFLQQYYTEKSNVINWNFLWICFAVISISYLVKYVSLLFTGWVTNYREEAKIYIFVVFLLNKIIGIFLLPFTLVMAFSSLKISRYAIFLSLVLLSILMLSRFFRAYSLLQNKLKFNKFHFFIYVLAIEIMPVVLIYKTVIIFFT
ncbi:MAG: DUF4271 domain-containing protein [Ferruginibacter sp.]|nr:DUF4271 domain-containing protein [Ferruginibacter sp.]